MSSHTTNLKQEGKRLHQSLLDGSRTATAEIAELFLQPLIKHLRGEFRQLKDPDLIDMAVADALVNYFERPKKFEPSRSSLFTYLRIRARTYLLNSLGQGASKKNVVELDQVETVYQMVNEVEPDAESSLVSNTYQAEIMQQVQKYITDSTDLRVVALMTQGVRDTTEYAEVLGITDRPFAEQKKTVKRHKDRINKIIERKIEPGLRRRQ
jgi:DNA-directed RNA polymerase specialized sigma24 family protein